MFCQNLYESRKEHKMLRRAIVMTRSRSGYRVDKGPVAGGGGARVDGRPLPPHRDRMVKF